MSDDALADLNAKNKPASTPSNPKKSSGSDTATPPVYVPGVTNPQPGNINNLPPTARDAIKGVNNRVNSPLPPAPTTTYTYGSTKIPVNPTQKFTLPQSTFLQPTATSKPTATTTTNQSKDYLTPAQIEKMPLQERLLWAINHAIDSGKLEASVKATLEGMKASLPVLAGVMVAWGASRFFPPAAAAFDASIAALGTLAFRGDVVKAGFQVYQFVSQAMNAESTKDLEASAQSFADFATTAGSAGLTSLFNNAGSLVSKAGTALGKIKGVASSQLSNAMEGMAQGYGQLERGVKGAKNTIVNGIDRLGELIPWGKRPVLAGAGAGSTAPNTGNVPARNNVLQSTTNSGAGANRPSGNGVPQYQPGQRSITPKIESHPILKAHEKYIQALGEKYPELSKNYRTTSNILAESTNILIKQARLDINGVKVPFGKVRATEALKSLYNLSEKKIPMLSIEIGRTLEAFKGIQTNIPKEIEIFKKLQDSSNFGKSIKGIKAHLSPTDLMGALRDKLEVPVIQGGDELDHLKETQDVIKSLRNLKADLLKLQGDLGSAGLSNKYAKEIELAKELIKNISAVEAEYLRFINPNTYKNLSISQGQETLDNALALTTPDSLSNTPTPTNVTSIPITTAISPTFSNPYLEQAVVASSQMKEEITKDWAAYSLATASISGNNIAPFTNKIAEQMRGQNSLNSSSTAFTIASNSTPSPTALTGGITALTGGVNAEEIKTPKSSSDFGMSC